LYALPTLDPYNPLVVTRDDGVQIQRTPTEGEITTTLDGSYTYHLPEQSIPYNTYYLKADSKGCNACHSDLAKTLESGAYQHVNLNNPYGIQVTVQMCIDCHTFGYGYLTNQHSFGTLVHGIHQAQENMDCWNCHVATGSGDGMQLWDKVKHWQLRGITPVPDAQGSFSFNQDKLIAAEELFSFGWNYFEWDYLRYDNEKNELPLDQDLFDEWTITFSGSVGRETTYTLPELIERFDSHTVPVTLHCTLNPTGGPLIGNNMVTGIRLSDVFADVGIDPNAGAFTAIAPDGFTESVLMSNFTEGYIVYQADGKPLSWKLGYPVTLLVPGTGAPASVKEVSDIIINTQEEAELLHEWAGWPKETEGEYYTPEGWPFNDSNGYVNKPNIGLFEFSEGQVIKTGSPYTFTGYADAWDETITAIEFSMDGGVTWTSYQTPGVNKQNWVIWNFSYTPEADSAYVLMIRAVTDTGRVTDEPIEVLFNSRAQ
jgi:DMSO/TMAO reductase YedYZ molybdopterin-dependent catalytic subunit